MPLFGRNDQEDQAHQVNGMYQNILEGGWGGSSTSNGFSDPNKLMSFMQNFLRGEAMNAGNMGARAGAGAAGALGLANPLSAIMRGRQQGYNSIAPQFGKVAMQVPQMSQQFRQEDFMNIMRLLQGRMGTTGAMDTGASNPLNQFVSAFATKAGETLGNPFGSFGGG